ncbi:Co2+/Mg2+ efflux protein ApaG [Sinimarinibacterium sp. CAU 1509]|uniref:Co2+/Mg2+ efflux protein ApaG n=1 Tax=Sinimarinibacterium sp. CAU 1509 TaxID=2562283 RepID=UPI0010AD6819|nr:Co2+/Mg2+ efflux protein ApaG [Sinimarinibacterium sp. CAU 1509]TJY58239.1 Co2+/Mg2+ efflux protein ApaG [Sinimarinibacterium sp. CAU 1509]
MSDTVTRGIRITVKPRYVAEQSDPDARQYLFAYHITIRNQSDDTVQLLSRHWVITNGEGQVEEVRGPGVVGYQPVLEPGADFEYTSGCPLTTPVGTMHGEFNMVVKASGVHFDAQIEPFRLAIPRVLN